MTRAIFHNRNGQDYTILETCVFNDVDADYYKNSWQKYRVALLDSGRCYVVANYLGEDSWGDGYYTCDKEQAIREYERVVKAYRG